MKIFHKSKRAVPPPPQVAELISKLLNTRNDDLSEVLSQIDAWKWPRSDLNAWTKVLNKFDAVLEDVIRDYSVDKIQINEFTPSTKKTVCEILRFERLLLENSTNRKMFSSYDRLNSFLFTEDLDVLILALNLLLRPSQQYSAQPSVSHALSISTPRLQSLAKRWPRMHEYGIGLVELVTAKGAPEVEALPSEAREVNFSFYRTDSNTQEKNKNMDLDSSDVFQPQKAASGAIQFTLDEQTVSSKSVMAILADLVEQHGVPESERFELMCRIRAAKVLLTGKEVDREKLIVVRLLAIAIFGHTHTESQASASLFLFEPDLIAHIAELLHVDYEIPVLVQTVAIAALDALARYRNKIQEVLTAINAGVNHGLLMALFRKTVTDIANPQSTLPHSFVEALLSFVTYIASHPSGGNMIVGAGLVPLLIQLIDNKLPNRLAVLSKTMQLVDNVLYSFPNAFHLFCNSRGVEILVERIEHEVDFDFKEFGSEERSWELHGPQAHLPVARASVLKHTLRSMHRMMQSSGTAEGLRGLIDLSLLGSIKKIIAHRGLFGPSVLPIAINIMATFVHNEPTSLSIIQEAGVPEVLYRAIEVGLEPAIEVIQAIPNALGALCLNEVGQAQLLKRPSIIPAIFSIFTSEQHMKILLDKEHSVLIGTAIDELIRHHPTLKPIVFESLRSTLTKIEDLGNAYAVPDNLKKWYKLAAIPPSAETALGEEAPMEGVVAPPVLSPPVVELSANRDIDMDDEEDLSTKSHDNTIVSFIDIMGRFLEGLFQHPSHCKDFITTIQGLERLGQLTGLPCLPYDYANSVASDSMVQVMRTMTEVSTNETLLHLTKLVKESLEDTKSFWEGTQSESRLLPLVEPQSSAEEDTANRHFRDLVTLHIRVTLLSDVFATASFAHGRAAVNLLQTLMNNTSPQVVSDLGALHRASVWENIVLNVGLALKGIDIQQTPTISPLDQSPALQSISLPDREIISTNGNENLNSATGDNPLNVLNQPSNGPFGPRDHNAEALKHLTRGLPTSLAPFFQAVVKTFNARRSLEAAQKKQIIDSSIVLANIMLEHLSMHSLGDRHSLFTYYSVMLGFCTLLLDDERSATHTLHTTQLFSFYRAGGIDAILKICREFTSSIEVLAQTKAEERSDITNSQLVHAYGGLTIAMHLLRPVTSSKALFETQQTVAMITRDKKDTDLAYFEPHNFLVKLRLAVFPVIRDIWESPWIISAPLSVTKAVISVLMELSNGENEELKGEVSPDPSSNAPSGTRSSGPDESRIQVLTDMGFPRSAAERALSRTHNNVAAATELLLSQPFPFPPDPESTAVAQADPTPASEEDAQPMDEQGDSEDVESDATSEVEGVETTANSEEVPSGRSHEELRKELNELREPLRAGISRRALSLIDEHVSLLFDLHTAFTRLNGPHQQPAVQNLVDDIEKFSPAAYDVQEQPLANRCRLLALVLCEVPSSLSSELRLTLLNRLVALLLSSSLSSDPGQTPPKWLAGHLLVTEALFTLSDEPRSISLPKEGEDNNAEPLSAVPPLVDAQKVAVVFDFCLKLLALSDLQSEQLLSVLRLLVLITRNHDLAMQFVKRDGLTLLFTRLKASPVNNSSSYVAIILRHTIEDASAVRLIMRQAMKRYFTQPRTRVVDMTTYVKNCNAMAFRDPIAFIEVTKSLCQLGQPFSPLPHVSLKPDPPSADNSEKVDEGGQLMQVESPSPSQSPAPTPSNEVLDSVVHFLVGELMSTSKRVLEQLGNPTQTSGAQPTDLQNKEVSIIENTAEQCSYACFIMQCLTELLFSYDSCKLAFLSYSNKRKNQTPAKDTTKHRTVTLNFLLSELISFGTIAPQPNEKHRHKISLCNWAMSVMVALCVDASSNQEGKDASPELTSVRKFVLEAVSRAVKDLPTHENLENRYGRLLALADLCHRLLTVRFNTSSRKQHDETPTYIGKVMLEKSFVATLTSALSEVDLNYPNVRGLVASVLRPLEHLTKIAIKMSRASSKTREMTDANKAESESSIHSEEEEEDVEDDSREETPDLYRHSALGMYGGEMDDTHYGGEDGMDEGEGDDEDVEMDYGEDAGSEDTSNSEDEAEEDELETGTRESTEVWDETDDEGEEDLVENADEEEDQEHDDNNEDNEEGDEEGDEEVLWQDIHGDDDAGGEEVDEEEGLAHPIQILHMEDQEEPEALSEAEDYSIDNNAADLRDVFGLTNAFINRDGSGGVFVPRRHRNGGDDNLQIFGRARNGPQPPREATTHPLLLDTSTLPPGPTSQTSRARLPHRFFPPGTIDLHQTIEDLIGGGAVQLFQHVMSRRGVGGTEIRLDMASGALVNFERGLLSQRRGPPIYSAAVRIERTPRPGQDSPVGQSLEPLLTLQRWAEEVKILHGDLVSERINKLINHVTLALLPDAIEELNRAKVREEEEAAKRLEARAKEEEETAAAAELSKQEAPVPEPETATETPPIDIPLVDPVAPVESSPEVTAEVPQVQQDQTMDDPEVAVPPGVDTEMADVTTNPPEPTDATTNIPESTETTDEQSRPTEDILAGEELPQAGTSAAPARVTVIIHGSPVDITETGIDPTFLEALPDDMREEVLNQHVRDQQAARVERPADSQISTEFLDALPPEIRAEILQQEAMERARHRAEESAPARAPADIDPASFIASLDPALRQAVLMEQDDGFIQTLPSHMIAEAGVWRERARARPPIPPSFPPHSNPQAPPRKFAPQHDAIQLLDKSGVAILIRLLFFPQVFRKTLFKVLVNLCENSKTRTELFNILLNILQDGTGDLVAVDKSFAQMSMKNSKSPQTPKAAGKQRAAPEFLSLLPSSMPRNDTLPDLIAQRCLEALTYIVSANDLSSLFFLTEHELPVGLRRASSKKGKGKEKQTSQTHYPIVLLLSLLDRQSLLRTPAIMESVVSLLATVTRPLANIKDHKEEEAIIASASEPSTSDDTRLTGTITSQPPLETTQQAEQPPAPQAPPEAASAEPRSSTSGDTQAQPPASKADMTIEAAEEKILLANPPQIPHPVLRLIVNILTVGECSGRTFQQSLALIQHLSYIPDARDVIAQELKARAQEFGQIIYSDLDQLAAALSSPSEDALVNSVASKFSPASSSQAKLLRVLKTIDYMYSPKGTVTQSNSDPQDAEKVQMIYESFRFTPLWRRLGDCLLVIEEKPQTEHIATVLLPLIEALMVVCKYVGSKITLTAAARALRASASPRSPTTPRESMEDLFVTFTDAHRKILNLMVRNNPSLMSGSFSLLVNNPRVLDFDNKRNYFNQQLHRRLTREHYGTLQLNVRRARVFEDSFQYLQRKTGEQIKYGKLSVRFYDEEGVDAGGVTREWFQILARQMFDPNNALFQPCAADKLTYQPNKNSWVNPEHLSFFTFVGRVIGKAIYDGRLLDAYFARSLYRQLLGKPVDYRDVEWVDPEYYNSLCWILENDPTLLELTFSVEADEFGVNRIVPLKEGGETIAVTQENKREFVQLSAQYRLYSSIKDQIESLSKGFYEIVPKELITIFNEQELELLISGTPDIDVDEWRAATEYSGYTSSDPNIVWWWRALKSFNRDERAKVLSFATGTSRVPLGGFTELQGVQGVQRFSIHRAYGESDRLPQAHTCFNQIDLPQYSSYEMLRQQLLLAINEGGEGFAFS